MANSSKRAGTEGENWWLTNFVQKLWPEADRAKSGNPGNDFHGPPIPIEAKRTKTWLIPKWTRYLHELHDGWWMLLVSPRDRRLKTAPPDIVIMPVELAEELWDAYLDHVGSLPELERVDDQ